MKGKCLNRQERQKKARNRARSVFGQRETVFGHKFIRRESDWKVTIKRTLLSFVVLVVTLHLMMIEEVSGVEVENPGSQPQLDESLYQYRLFCFSRATELANRRRSCKNLVNTS